MNAKILFLTNDTPKARYLEAIFHKNGVNIDGVITFSRNNRVIQEPIVHRFLKLVYRRLNGLASYKLTTARILRLEKKCKAISEEKLEDFIQSEQKNLDKFALTNRIVVTDINSLVVESELKKVKPDICIVWGTPILKPKILDLCPVFVNAHTSILPHYKGTFSEFWQCYKEDEDNIGVTFHIVDKGVDTGAIIHQVFQEVNGPLEPYRLRLNNTKLILQHYPSVIKSFMAGELKVQAQSSNKASSIHTYRSSDITIEKRLQLYTRLKIQYNNLVELLEANSLN